MKTDGLLIGIDGGGTKTDLCLARTDGTVVRQCGLPGTNPSDIGVEASFQRLAGALRDAGAAFALYAGIAGAGNPTVACALTEKIRSAFPAIGRVVVGSDAFNALNGEIGLSDGIAMIAGTGASAFVRRDGRVTQVGGWGPLVDDAGGGFALGRACLRAAYRALDGRGESTILLARVEERLGAPLRDGVSFIHEGGASRVASFATIALDAAKENDAVAARLVEHCANEIARHVEVCAERFSAGRAVCVLSGGMFRDDGLLKLVLEKTAHLGLDMRRATLPPVYGALVSAAALCGAKADKDFRENYERTVGA